MMMRADKNYTPSEGCTTEQIVACALEDDTAACLAACSDNEEPNEDEEPVGNAEVRVSRVGSTTSQTVAYNAVAKKIGTIKLTAGDEDAVVSSLTIAKKGLAGGSVKFFIEKDGVRVSPKANMSDNKTSVSVRFSPAVTIKANKSETFDIVADFTAETNSQFEFSVSDMNVANGKATGTPVSLGTVNTTSYAVGTIRSGSIILTKGDDQKAGDVNKLFATLQITLPTKETKFDGFTLTKESGKEDLYDLINNVKAYYNGEEIGKVKVDAEKIVVSNLNIVKAYAEQVTIELKSDCIYVGNNEPFSLSIQANDIDATETNTDERLATEGITAVPFTIAGVNLTADSLITASQTVAPGTAGVELFKAKVSSNSAFDITNYTLTFETPDNVTTGNFTSVIAYVNGADYELDLDKGNSWTFTKDDAFAAPATIRVVANISSNSNPVTHKLTLTLNTGKNDSNIDMPLGVTVIGHSTTVNNGGFTLTRQADTPTNRTILEGTAENVLYFKLRANAEDQIMKTLVVSLTSGDAVTTGLNEIATRVDLMKGTTTVKSLTNSADLSGKTITFSDLSERLTKDTDVNYTVKVTLKGGEVNKLGKTAQFSIATGTLNIVRAAQQATATTTTSPDFVGTKYSISSNKPTVKITDQVGKNTTVKFTNDSSYYVVLDDITMEMTRNSVNGTYVNWGGTGKLLQAVNGPAISTDEKAIPGSATWNFNVAGYNNLDTTLDVVVELFDPANTVNPENYTVTIKSVSYHFVDKTDASKFSTTITETYNETEDK